MSSEKHVSLGLVFHNHQPVGQSDEVFEEIYAKAYELMIAALERHPGVHIGLHYTGSLLDWLREHEPVFMERICALVERGQVEILSGGYYEPILPSIPDDSKLMQILKLTEAVKHDFGYDPTGMWLAERVWEPALPSPLSRAGITWTILDDSHFKMVGLTDYDLTGYYVTEDNGEMVYVFGTSKQMRYTIPWRPVEEALQFLYDQAVPEPGKIFVMGDDGEKFGAWPDTYAHCWGDDGMSGWVDEFFAALEANVSWLHTVKLGEHVQTFPAMGRIYLPTASYNEMMEWALPPGPSYEFTQLFHRLEAEKDPAAKYMKGGFWRNFMAKYPEINTQHKKMLRVHDKIAQAHEKLGGRAATTDIGQEDLLRSQSNDTYWHGLFGGVYMTDVRVRVQSYMLRAQAAAEHALYGDQNWVDYEITDFDCDSMQELLVEGNALNLYIDLADGGSIFEWDLRKHNYNLASTVSRRPEAYHQTLREVEEKRRASERNSRSPERSEGDAARPKNEKDQAAGSEEPLSPHEAVRVKEEGLDRLLFYDRYRKACAIDHFVGPGTTLESFVRGEFNEEGDFVNGMYEAELEPVDDPSQAQGALHVVMTRDGWINTEDEHKPVRVSKRLTVKPGSPDLRVRYTIQNTGNKDLTAVFGSEWNVNLLGGGHNPSAYYRVEGVELEDAALDSTGEVRNVTEFAVGNSWLNIEMACKLNHEATFWRYPIETVSGSEAGFERVYQGSCMLLTWLLKLSPDDSVDIELEWLYNFEL